MRVLLYGAVLGAGFLLTALTGQLAWAAWAAYRDAPATALEARAEGAPDGRWVRVIDLSFRCDTKMESRGSTFFLADGGAARTPVAVHLLGSAPCPTAPLEGGFLPGTFTRTWLREKFDVTFPGASAEGPDVRLFTSTLTPEYQRRALLRLLPLLGLGLLMAAVGGRGLYRAIRRRSPGVGPARRAAGRD